jgi:hypothetical protein
MFSERRCFLEDGDLDLAEISAGLRIFFRESSELDGAGEARRSSADEHDIHWDRFSVERLAYDQPVDRQRRLVREWKN